MWMKENTVSHVFHSHLSDQIDNNSRSKVKTLCLSDTGVSHASRSFCDAYGLNVWDKVPVRAGVRSVHISVVFMEACGWQQRGVLVDTHTRTHSGQSAWPGNQTALYTKHLHHKKRLMLHRKHCCSDLWSETDISAFCKINTSLVNISP